MSIDVLTPDRIPMSQKERDVLKIMHVQPRITLGGSRSSGASDKVRTADISTVAKMRTFLLSPDTRMREIVATVPSGG